MQKQMAVFRHIWNRLRAFGKADKIHHEVSEEFAFHLDMKVAELMNSGMGEEEARCIAQQSFGRQTALREQAFALRGAEWLEDFWRDLRFSFRLMQKNLGRTAVLAATLALGIGLSAALFSIVRSILLRPLPFADSGSLVILHQATGSGAGGVSYPHYRDWKAGSRSFEGMAVFSTGESTLTALDHAERVNAATVSANLFSLLRVHPLRGRLFRSDEDRVGGGTGGERPILINEEFWRGHMGGRNDIVGRHVTLDGFSFRIAGVIPAALSFPAGSTSVAFWTTVAMDAEPSIYGGAVPEARGYPRYDGVIARLRPGITAQKAAADMKRLASVIAAAHPNATGMNDVVVRSALGELVGPVRPLLLLLNGAVFCVLLVACANATTLLLVGGMARRREFGIRSALGAPAGRLVRQILIEHVCLSLCGGGAGFLLAVVLVKFCVAVAPAGTPRLGDVKVDTALFLYSLAIALVVGILVGIVPALAAGRRDLQQDLRDTARASSPSRGTMRMGTLLITAQVAVCMVLSCAAMVLTNSFLHVLNASRGFDPHSVLTGTISLPPTLYPQGSDRVRNYFRDLIVLLQSQPGVLAVSVAEHLPLSGTNNSTTVQVVGRPEPGLPSTNLEFVSEDYFRVLRIPLISGRLLTATDDGTHPGVALVNRAFVRRFLGGGPAENRLLKLGWGGSQPKRIVGVVADLRSQALDVQAKPEVYIPAGQFPNNDMAVLLRTDGHRSDTATMLRNAIRKLDLNIPVDRIRTLDKYLLLSVATQIFLMSILAVFALSTLVIAAIGLYGILSYTTARRTQEFGIRMALGSSPARLLGLVLRQGLGLSLAGVLIGTMLSLTTARLLSQWLYQTAPADWINILPAALLLMAVALLASWMPARRASRTDPLIAIRAE